MRPEPHDLHQILRSALRAPSADNCHRLRWRIDADAVGLWATDTESWAEHPHLRFLALLAMGAVIENMMLRSAQLGWELSAGLCPDAERPDLIATFEWQPARSDIDPLADFIEQRVTNRRFYGRSALPAQALSAMRDAAAAVPGAELIWLGENPRRAVALSAIRQAETQRFRQRALHGELFGAIRFDLGWVQSAARGLPPAALEIEPFVRSGFALLRHWPFMRLAQAAGAHHLLGLRAAYLPCALAPHLGLIVQRQVRGDADMLQSGRALQRTWLAATRSGWAFQPMAAATTLARQSAGHGWVDPHVQQRLRAVLSALTGDPAMQPTMLFRVGRAAAPSVRTGRQSLSHHLE